MAKPIKGKDGKFQGSVGDGKAKIPTPAPHASTPDATTSTGSPSYSDQFDRMKAATSKATRAENGVTWTESRTEHRGDGYTIIDERTTGTYTGLKSEGYTGVKPGMPVNVNRTQWIRPDGSLSNESYSCSRPDGGAWLAVHDPENDLRLDGNTQPQPATRAVTSLITAGAAFRIYRHSNADGSGYTWSADGTFSNPVEPGTAVDVPNVWAGPNSPSEQDLKDAAQRYRDSL